MLTLLTCMLFAEGELIFKGTMNVPKAAYTRKGVGPDTFFEAWTHSAKPDIKLEVPGEIKAKIDETVAAKKEEKGEKAEPTSKVGKITGKLKEAVKGGKEAIDEKLLRKSLSDIEKTVKQFNEDTKKSYDWTVKGIKDGGGEKPKNPQFFAELRKDAGEIAKASNLEERIHNTIDKRFESVRKDLGKIYKEKADSDRVYGEIVKPLKDISVEAWKNAGFFTAFFKNKNSANDTTDQREFIKNIG